jgi:peptide/nickel transport system permease protein
MAKASLAPVPLTSQYVDDAILNAALTRGGSRFLQILKQAAWEMWRSRLAAIGTVMLLSLFLVAALAPAIARYDPVKQNYREMLQGPSAAHYFGTDKFGRDIWSRVVWGCRRSVTISVLAVIAGVCCGVTVGTISG